MAEPTHREPTHISAEDVELIARIIAEQAPRFVDRDQHHNDHQWVQAKREAEEKLIGSKRRVIETIVGTVGTVGFLGVMTWIGHSIIESLVRVVP